MIDGFPVAEDPTRARADTTKSPAQLAARVAELERSLVMAKLALKHSETQRELAQRELTSLRSALARVRLLQPRAHHLAELCGNGGYERETLNHGPECKCYFDGVTDAQEALDGDPRDRHDGSA